MDDIILAKVATIEKCLIRIQQEFKADWKKNYTHQDALLLNLERACQATIDCGSHIVRKRKLGIPKTSREIFDLLAKNKVLDNSLADSLKKMVGFRNLAVHDYANLNLDILESIIKNDLTVFQKFSKSVIKLKL